MNHYEAAMLLNPGMSDKDVEKFVAEMHDLLAAKEAVEIDDGRVERRHLAYPVKKNTEGYYVFIQFDAPPTLPDAMKLELKHREELLRLAFIRRPSPAELAAKVESKEPEPEATPAPEPESGPDAAPAEQPAAEEPAAESAPEPTEPAETTEPAAADAGQPEAPTPGERDDG